MWPAAVGLLLTRLARQQAFESRGKQLVVACGGDSVNLAMNRRSF